ncbi:hypothetical protein RPX00_27385 [Amycolatopsis sp. WGS_07]
MSTFIGPDSRSASASVSAQIVSTHSSTYGSERHFEGWNFSRYRSSEAAVLSGRM